MNEFALETEAVLENIPTITTFIEEKLAEFGADDEFRGKMGLALDEAVTNVVLYAYPEKKGLIRLTLKKTGETIVAEIRDQGTPFDPTQAPPPDLTVPLEQRKIGGLGIHLMRKSVDQLTYRHENGSNVFTFSKNMR